MSAVSLAKGLFWALLLLQPVWHAWLAPPERVAVWLVLGVFLLPLLPVAVLLLRGCPSALFWAGVVALLYFSHGVMEAWAAPAVRGLALAETCIALALVLAVGFDGLRRRQAAKRAAAGAAPIIRAPD